MGADPLNWQESPLVQTLATRSGRQKDFIPPVRYEHPALVERRFVGPFVRRCTRIRNTGLAG